MKGDVKERLELALVDTRERVKQGQNDIVRGMAASSTGAGMSWDSPIIRTHRARLAAARADLAILEALLGDS